MARGRQVVRPAFSGPERFKASTVDSTPTRASRHAPAGGQFDELVRLFEDEPVELVSGPFTLDQIELLVQASLKDLSKARGCINNWLRQGHSLSDIYLHGITAAARLVGHSWAQDCLDFGSVTVVSSNLHRLLYEFSPQFQSDAQPHHGGTILIFPEPGAQHTMGGFMLAEFFRRGGWFVLTALPKSQDECVSLVSKNWVDTVAVSISSDRHVHTLGQWIASMRQASTNTHLKVMAGGPMAQVNPGALSGLHADVLGKDALEAVNWAWAHGLSHQKFTQ